MLDANHATTRYRTGNSTLTDATRRNRTDATHVLDLIEPLPDTLETHSGSGSFDVFDHAGERDFRAWGRLPVRGRNITAR
jgi:hypothetical protein